MRAKSFTLGIDPGLNGALAFWSASEDLLETFAMPTLETSGGRRVDEYAVARIIDERSQLTCDAFVEVVSGRPGEGHVNSFRFGWAYGIVRGVCAANFIPLHDAPPAQWKRVMKAQGEKDEARLRASALFPRFSGQWSLKKQHGQAEAALIARWGAERTARLEAA